MKEQILILLMLFVSIFSNAQNFEKLDFNPDTLDFSSTDKICKQKDFLIRCMDFYLSKRYGDLSEARMKCFKVFVKLNSNSDFRVERIQIQPRKLISGGNMANRTIYWIGQTKLQLEDKNLLVNDSLLVSKSVELYLDYCFNKNNKVPLTSEMKRVNQLRETGFLNRYIKQLIEENGN